MGWKPGRQRAALRIPILNSKFFFSHTNTTALSVQILIVNNNSKKIITTFKALLCNLLRGP